MKVTKELNKNKGITLIALVITIIVMLILVAVTISMAVNGGLFDYAGKATGETQNAIGKEQTLANGKVNVDEKWYNNIDDYITGKYEGYVPTYKEAKFENGVLTENSTYTTTENGKTYTAVIPKGFKVLETEGTTIQGGLVITDSNETDEDGENLGNQFVWIPVEKAIVTEDEIAKIIKNSGNAEMTKVQAVQSLVNSGTYPMAIQVGTDYKGILYSFTHNADNTLTLTVRDWNDTDSFIEPDNLDGKKTLSSQTTVNGIVIPKDTSYKYDSQDMFTLYGGGTYLDTMYQTSFKSMVKSVEKNGGFYVGRYEISNESDLQYAESKKGKTALVSTTWYKMYKLEKAYAEENECIGVVSEMIWGSQWDQIMIFVNGKNDGAENPVPFYVAKCGSRYSNSSSTKTGMNPKGDEVANIFDLEASREEWTQEAYTEVHRVPRGGVYEVNFITRRIYPAATRSMYAPSSSYDDRSSRISLYVIL